MNELPALFADTAVFRHAFTDILERQVLAADDLGAFILVLANASTDPDIAAVLGDSLRRAHADWADRHAAGGLPQAPDDDLAVLERLLAAALPVPGTTDWRRVGPWQVQFNALRALRPARMATARVTELCVPFRGDGFHFNKPFLRREILWEGDLLGRSARLLYNKFPFAGLHGLLLIHPEREQPQCLLAGDHRAAWECCAAIGRGIPGWGLGYNAYGAYASVNHQHFQSYVGGAGGYPVEDRCWAHNGGDVAYPLPCSVFDDPDAAWARLNALHAANRPYNLLYRPGRLYLLERRFQGSYAHAAWTGGFAWSEVAGSLTLTERAAFDALDETAVAAEFARLRPADA